MKSKLQKIATMVMLLMVFNSATLFAQSNYVQDNIETATAMLGYQIGQNKVKLANIHNDLLAIGKSFSTQDSSKDAEVILSSCTTIRFENERAYYIINTIITMPIIRQDMQSKYSDLVKETILFSIAQLDRNIAKLVLQMTYCQNKAIIIQIDKAKDTIRTLKKLYQDALELVKT
jgi:hypothetical protein